MSARPRRRRVSRHGFGARLRAAIERSGKSLRSIADTIGKSQGYLSDMAAGRAPSVDRAVALCRELAAACGCSVEFLLGLEEEEKEK